MELKVWVEGIQRIVCNVTDSTTCQVCFLCSNYFSFIFRDCFTILIFFFRMWYLPWLTVYSALFNLQLLIFIKSYFQITATGKTGRFTLIERWRNNSRLLAPTESPLKVLSMNFFLKKRK